MHMHGRHSLHVMQHMQPSPPGSRPLLTALEVQQLLHIDRSTVYRMAEDGRLPAIRVGRSWRFPADRIEAMLAAATPPNPAVEGPAGPATAAPAPVAPAAVASATAAPGPAAPGPVAPAAPATAAPGPAVPGPAVPGPADPGTVPPARVASAPPPGMIHAGSAAKGLPNPHGSWVGGAGSPIDRASAAEPALDLGAAGAAVEVAADLLGVMMVVTDMSGRPLTGVVNPCPWFAEHGTDRDVLDQCVAEWRDLADHPDLSPRFQPGALGFECARAFIREGTTLVGMVLAGGVSPSTDPGTHPDLYHLDGDQRDRVLAALPRIAAAIATRSPVPPPTTAPIGAVTKEN
jgi:excisionase family DNA binding protein